MLCLKTHHKMFLKKVVIILFFPSVVKLMIYIIYIKKMKMNKSYRIHFMSSRDPGAPWNHFDCFKKLCLEPQET